MVVGFAPGGGTDVVARILAPKLSELLGQPLVIENRPGATGTAAAAMVAKSPPDGYTIMMGHVSVNAIAPSLFANLQYDAIRDFAPVALAVSSAGRLPAFPDVPTAEEAGLPGYRITTWYGVFAPAGTPAAIVRRLHADTVKAMQSPETRSKLEGVGADGTVSRSPEEFAALVRADTARYAGIVKRIGLKIDSPPFARVMTTTRPNRCTSSSFLTSAPGRGGMIVC